jgi:peptidoglycan pentaglycine glycine transferase (the first glycine)
MNRPPADVPVARADRSPDPGSTDPGSTDRGPRDPGPAGPGPAGPGSSTPGSPVSGSPRPSGVDGTGWDAFVAATPDGSYLQMTPWATVKALNGWSARRVMGTGSEGPVGAQVLLRRRPPLPWAFGYAPRGPVATRWAPDAVRALTTALRDQLSGDPARPASVRVEPAVEARGPDDPGGSLVAAFRAAGWRPVDPVQPPSSRVIELHRPEDAIWGDLRGKWRQYVNRARRGGIVVVSDDGGRLGDLHRLLTETAQRTGMRVRTEASYRAVWDAFRPAGMAELLIALGPDGEAQAALFLIRCGDRVVEPYGGMTAAGATSRANYLLKWEAIRRAREQGAATYDLWGLVHPGIAHFKAGFGGREIRYIGGFELPLAPVGDRVVRLAMATRGRLRSDHPVGDGGARRGDDAGDAGGGPVVDDA